MLCLLFRFLLKYTRDPFFLDGSFESSKPAPHGFGDIRIRLMSWWLTSLHVSSILETVAFESAVARFSFSIPYMGNLGFPFIQCFYWGVFIFQWCAMMARVRGFRKSFCCPALWLCRSRFLFRSTFGRLSDCYNHVFWNMPNFYIQVTSAPSRCREVASRR